jgi:hypothetical protein
MSLKVDSVIWKTRKIIEDVRLDKLPEGRHYKIIH